MKSTLNHIAILVESIESALIENSFSDELLGPIEEFPSEGTRELYVGHDNQMGRLLFMQAIGDGPYNYALKKRGPGLHHIALDVEDIDRFVDRLSGSGWSLHPKSLGFYKSNRQVYLCRAGLPLLMEIQERKGLKDNNYFVDKVEFPFKNIKMLEVLACDKLSFGESLRLLKNGEQVCQSST